MMARGEGGQDLCRPAGEPLVSVVMGVFNAAAALEGSLQSLLAQTGVEVEIIAVNDGSRDASGSLLDEWAARDGRLRVLHQENLGLTAALRRACAAARGKFIARHDADDVSLPGRLEAQVRYLEAHPEIPTLGPAGGGVTPTRQRRRSQRLAGRTVSGSYDPKAARRAAGRVTWR